MQHKILVAPKYFTNYRRRLCRLDFFSTTMQTPGFKTTDKALYFLHSYGISPLHGSEKGVGYKWICELGKSFRVVVFCEAEFAESCYQHLAESDLSVSVRPVSIGEAGRRIIWDQGTWIAYLILTYYHLRVLFAAVGVCISLKERPKIAHHLSMIGFRSPGYLALFRLLGAKVVWGPIGGLNTPAPDIYADYGPRVMLVQRIKNVLNVLCLALPSVLLWRALASKKLVVVRPQSKILAWFFRAAPSFPETFCKEEFTTAQDRSVHSSQDRLRVVATGKPNYRKLHRTLLIELEAVATELCETHGLDRIELTILGCTDADLQKIDAPLRGPHFEVFGKFGMLDLVKDTLEESEVFVHLSVDEGTSHAVAEAASMGLPIICFDAGGHTAYLCDKDIVMKYPKRRSDISSEFRKALAQYVSDRDRYLACKPCANVVIADQGVQKFLGLIGE